MCGIAGILSFDCRHRYLENIQFMTDSMRRRGPDGEGFAFFFKDPRKPCSFFGGRDTPEEIFHADYSYTPREPFEGEAPSGSILALGHRRLAIIDLTPAGHQPMCTEDGRYWIVFNGEVYNFKDIRRDLAEAGDGFTSDTDTEVVLKAYRRWGPNCVNRFNGMWAFAVWDRTRGELFCCRDRIGIKPFYYTLSSNLFLFASDIKALIASRLFQPEADWEGIYHAMSFYCAPRPTTCFKNVFSLEQGCWMIVDGNGKTSSERYWSLPLNGTESPYSESLWREALENSIGKAVRRRLIADVPVGAFMSGGIDSTTVSAFAARENPGLTAFTLAFDHVSDAFDELPQARATAAMLPIKHIMKKVSPEELLNNIEKLVQCYEEPFYSLSPTFVISQLVAENRIKVVLHGLGPDELLSGYNRTSRLQLWRLGRILPLSILPFSLENPRWNRLHSLFQAKTISDYYVYVFSTFKEREKKKLFRIPDSSEWSSPERFASLYQLKDIRFKDHIEAICYMDLINYIGNHQLYRLDQFTMHFSIEGRVPFLDHELVELCFRMPSTMKRRGKTGKYILRKVAEKHIHPSCLSMPKKGFGLPMDHWIRFELKNLVESALNQLKKRDDMFYTKAIDELRDAYMEGRDSYEKLWFLVSLQMWLDAFSL